MATTKKRRSSKNATLERALKEHRRKQAAQADLAYDTARWTRVVFEDEVREGATLAQAVKARPEGTWEAMCRELFGRLYGVGTKKKDEVAPGNEWAENLHGQADELPEWKAAQARSKGDGWLAGLGAAQAGEVLRTYLPELPEEDMEALFEEIQELEEKAQKGKLNRIDLKRLKALRARQKAGQEQASAVQAAMQQNPAGMRRALRQAGQAAAQAVNEAADAMEVACGSGAGSDQRRVVAKRLQMNDALRRILARAGRLRRHILKKRAAKNIPHANEEVCSVTMGSNIMRLLPTERANLLEQTRAAHLYSRLLEGSALQYEMKGHEKAVGGPIMFVIDESGSMSGYQNEWAKALALAMMTVARDQKRPFGILHFDDGVRREDLFDTLNPDTEHMLDALSYFSGGGTNIARALGRAAALIEDPSRWKVSQGRAWDKGAKCDVVLITDGQDGSHSECLRLCEQMTEYGASVYAITLGYEAPKASWMRTAAADYVTIDTYALSKTDGNAEEKLGGLIDGVGV